MPRTLQLSPPLFEPLSYSEDSLKILIHWLDTQRDFFILPGELSIAFLDEKSLAKIHGDFLDDPTPTDVITFPGDEDGFAGEILLSAERALNEAPKHNQSFTEELTLYLIHGWLHLAGLDDINNDDRAEMRKAEALLMDRIKKAGMFPDFSVKV